MTQPPQDPNQPQDPSQYPAAPPPPPVPPSQGGWGQPPAPGAPGYGAPGYGAPGGYHAYGTPTPYAEWIKRVGAYLVDVAVMLPAYIPMAIGVPLMTSDSSGAAAVGWVLYLVGVLAVIGVAVWNILIRQGRTGWSVGKQVLGIRLISEKTGEPIGAGMCFVRQLAHILDSLPCYLGYLWPLWDAKRQTFADKIIGTVVIEAKKPA